MKKHVSIRLLIFLMATVFSIHLQAEKETLRESIDPPATLSVRSEKESLEVVTARIRDKILSAGFRDPSELLNTMKSDGSWEDIDYQDQHSLKDGWDPNRHFIRLGRMAIAFKHPGSPYYNDASLLEKIVSGCEFVCTWEYPKDLDNWFWNSIGDPQQYMVPLLFIKDDVPSADIQRYATFIPDQTDKASHEGKNRASVSLMTIYKGCIENDFNLVMKGFSSMASILAFAETQFPILGDQRVEGIKADYSFHQHRRQIQPGSYGLSLIPDITNCLLYVSGTLFESAFSKEQRDIFSRLLREGHLLFSYRRTMDFGTRGRAIASESHHYTGIDEVELNKMIRIDPENAAIYTAWIRHLDGAPFPVTGNKYFWESEIMTHHGEDYYLSAKVISKRTNGTEMINGENRRGFNFPLGATNIMTTGNEYHRISPVWDWNRIPGTTAAQDIRYATLDGYHYGPNEFAGGVSDSVSGIIAYQHDFRGLRANKAYFFMGDALLCVGAGITATHEVPVETSVNQCFRSGDIYYSDGNHIRQVEDSVHTRQVKWIHHDQVGYLFPQPLNITIEGKDRTGTWRDIDDAGSPEPVTAPVFSTRIHHGVTPKEDTYQYIVSPGKSLEQTKEYSEHHGLEVVRNDTEVQAVFDTSRNQYGIVFYSSGTVILKKDLAVSCDTPCILLLKVNENEYSLSVADPTYSQNTIYLTITNPLTGKNAVIDPSGKETRISFSLPGKQYTGSTVYGRFTGTGK